MARESRPRRRWDQSSIVGTDTDEDVPQVIRAAVNEKPDDTVLVVDDDQDIREALCDLLADAGYRAASVANGKEALIYLKSGELPCVILLDLMMPVMDGWEFRRQQQGDPRLSKIPVVVITAAGTQG